MNLLKKINLRNYLFIFLVVNTIYYLFWRHPLYEKLLFLNNLHDVFNIFTIFIIISHLGNIKMLFKQLRSVRYAVIFFIIFFIYIFISFVVYDFTAIKAQRFHITGTLLILGVVALISKKEINHSLFDFYTFYKIQAITIIIMGGLRALDVLPMYYGEESYSKLRFINNYQALSLVIYFIFHVYMHKYKAKNLKFNNFLAAFSFLAVLASTQRAVTFAFGFFLIFFIFYHRKYLFKNVGYILLLFLLFITTLDYREIYETLHYALYERIFVQTESSHGYNKFQDILAGIEYILNNQLYLGRLFQLEYFERARGGFYSPASRGFHNLFIVYFISGGFLLIIPYILLWLREFLVHLRFIFTKYTKHNKELSKMAFWLMFVTFFVVNSTAQPTIAALTITPCIVVELFNKQIISHGKSIYHYKIS